MLKSDFYFDLPEELIAQHPLEKRDHSRLLMLGKESGGISHGHFYDILDLLKPGDLLVVNNSRVIPARLYGVKEDTGAAMEFLLLEQKEKDVWEILVKPGRRAKPGTRFVFGDGLLRAEILEVLEGGNRLVRFEHDSEKNIFEILDVIGQMPLPPYITAKLEDKERYQTVYSKELGSAAAPTAGLHFTPELMEKLREKGVRITDVTLHVGLGTFRPVKEDNVLDHKMHSEHYQLPAHTAELIRE
ncbi:MAG: tRNA preQ1(34) S-adenosylmethionine ribosyltransferase-isomerase QueA, partial [Oscillospiraceae bacterium]|nr:tRNA preQ1(34) S-adenosylmethionine ribosyltransferase-isomerase QueA [Oscillospiraceae bacterium]